MKCNFIAGSLEGMSTCRPLDYEFNHPILAPASTLRFRTDYVNSQILLIFATMLHNLQSGGHVKLDVIFDFLLRPIFQGLL